MNKQLTLKNYILAQGELGGFEVVLPKTISVHKVKPQVKPPAAVVTPTVIPKSEPVVKQVLVPTITKKNESETWEKAQTIEEFYGNISKSAVYKNGNIEKNTPLLNSSYLLVFHSPDELSLPTEDLLKKILAAIKIDDGYATSYFIKSRDIKTVLPRTNKVLCEMLVKETFLLNPEKIIFWGNLFAEEIFNTQMNKIAGSQTLFAGKPSIVLPSLKEILANIQVKRDVWNIYLRKSGWFDI